MSVLLQVMLGTATVFVSICAVVVSWAQWEVANTDLQFQLFDRRLHIKEAILDLASCYIRELSITGEAFGKFHSEAFGCRLLFPDAAADWIKTLDDAAWRFVVLSGELERESNRPQCDNAKIEKLNNENLELARFFENLFNEADSKLDPYLKIQ